MDLYRVYPFMETLNSLSIIAVRFPALPTAARDKSLPHGYRRVPYIDAQPAKLK